MKHYTKLSFSWSSACRIITFGRVKSCHKEFKIKEIKKKKEFKCKISYINSKEDMLKKKSCQRPKSILIVFIIADLSKKCINCQQFASADSEHKDQWKNNPSGWRVARKFLSATNNNNITHLKNQHNTLILFHHSQDVLGNRKSKKTQDKSTQNLNPSWKTNQMQNVPSFR